MPFEKTAPMRTHAAEIDKIKINGAAFEPIAELRKFTASLLTPITRSDIARIKSTITINR